MIAKAWANTIPMIMAVKILGALEGFLPKAVMLAKLAAANTAQGPKTQSIKITIRERLRLIKKIPVLFLDDHGYLIAVDFYYSPLDQKITLVDKKPSGNQAADQPLMKWQDLKNALLSGKRDAFCLAFKNNILGSDYGNLEQHLIFKVNPAIC